MTMVKSHSQKRHRLVASCQFYRLFATCQQGLSVSSSCNKPVKIRLVAICHLQTYNRFCFLLFAIHFFFTICFACFSLLLKHFLALPPPPLNFLGPVVSSPDTFSTPANCRSFSFHKYVKSLLHDQIFFHEFQVSNVF